MSLGEIVVRVNAPVLRCAIPMGVNVSVLRCAVQMGCKRFTCMVLRCVLAELMCGCTIRKGDSVLVLERVVLARHRASRRCCRVLEEKASGRQQVPMPWRWCTVMKRQPCDGTRRRRGYLNELVRGNLRSEVLAAPHLPAKQREAVVELVFVLRWWCSLV